MVEMSLPKTMKSSMRGRTKWQDVDGSTQYSSFAAT